MKKMIKSKLTEEQERFLKIFKNNKDSGDLDLSCEMANLPKSLVEEWSNDDPLFWEKIEDIKDMKKWNLIKKVQKGDAGASIRFLQIYAKDRGYSE